MTIQEIRQTALVRATSGSSALNYLPIFMGFMEKGISENEIIPRENVLTYHAWQAKGRHVRKGEHGVKVTTWIDVPEDKRKNGKSGKICKTTTVFHVSQTDPLR